MELSHIWVGTCESEDVFQEYFRESYTDGDRVDPLNKFSESQGELFYDHDWLERSFREEAALAELIGPHSYSEDYMDAVIEHVQELKLQEVNAFILADKELFSHPRSIEHDELKLWYLGLFRCNA